MSIKSGQLQNGRLSGVTDTDGTNARTTTVTVDANGYLTRITDPDGGYDSYGYDGSDRLHTITDRRANTTTYNYDAAWKLSQIVSPSVPIDAGGGSTTNVTPTTSLSSWQAVGVPTTSTASTPASLTLPSSIVAHMISPTNDTTTFTPDRWGQVLSTIDPLGRMTTVERNGVFATVVHHPDGSVDSASYSNGLVTTLREAGRSTVHIRYGVFAQPDSTWGGGSAAQRIFLNSSNGNADSVRHTGPTPNVARYTYDALGRMVAYRDEVGHTTRYAYDASLGDADSVTNAVGAVVRTVLDEHGRPAAYMNGVDSLITFVYDSLNRQVAVSQGTLGVPVQTIYDGLLPTDVIDRNANHTVMHYNALGWLTDRCDPTEHCTYYRYDASGRATSETNRRGQQINRTYDRLGRLLVKSGDSTTTDTFVYGSDNRGVIAQNGTEVDSLRLRPGTSVLGAADTVITHVNGTRFQLIHGDLGSWAGVDSTVITTTAPSVTFRKRYRYADTTTGLVTSYNDGFSTMAYSYTGDWLQSASTDVTGTRNASFLPTHVVNWTQFTASGLSSLDRSQQYDPLLRIKGIFTADHTPGSGTSFAYDSTGRLAQTETFTGCTVATGDSTYGIAWSSCSGHSVPNVYSYDNEGNRISQGGVYDIGNRVLRNDYFAYTHDLDGNITQGYNLSTGADYHFTWSSDGRLTDVSYKPSYSDSAGSIHYNYNAYGQPVLRSIGSSVPNRVWLYDRGQLLGEFDAGNGNQRVAEYVYNEGADDPYGVIFGATTPTRIDYLELDQSGNVLGAHEEATVTMTVNYDDWGAPTISSGTRVGNVLWKGLHRDEYTGMYYARARWYDPILGSFVSEDPAGFAGGVNPYTFAGDDPINGRDPTGMFAGGIFGRIGSTLCGKVCEFIGDVLHIGPSKVPHAPPLRGVNPGARVFFVGVHGTAVAGAGAVGGFGAILWSDEGFGVYATGGGALGGDAGVAGGGGESTSLSSFRGSSNGIAGGGGLISVTRSSNSAGSTWFGGWGPNFFPVSEHVEHTWTKTLTAGDAIHAIDEQMIVPSMLWINQGINQMNAASGIR